MNNGQQSHLPDDDLNVMSTASEDEVRELNEGLLELPESQQGKTPKEELDEGTQGAQGNQGGEDDDEDERTARVDQELRDAPDEAARQAIRERNKANRLNQRQRAKQRIETLERQLANSNSLLQDQAQRLAALEGGQRGQQYAGLQQQEEQANQAEERLKAIIAEATVKGDGVTVAEATSRLVQVQSHKENLVAARTQFEQEQQQPRRQPLHPQVIAHAKNFMAKHPWYQGPRSQDLDSQFLAAIDRSLVNEGWNPATPAYWEEFEARATQRLPHRFGGGAADQGGGGDAYNQGAQPSQGRPGTRPATRRSPVADGGSGSQPNGGVGNGQTIRLSAERVRALKEAGMWDDPEKRKKMIKVYADLDRNNRNAT